MEINNNKSKVKPKPIKLKPLQKDEIKKSNNFDNDNDNDQNSNNNDMQNFINKKNSDIVASCEVVKPKSQPKQLEPIDASNHNKKQDPLQLLNVEKRFDLTESYQNNLQFLNEDNEIDKTETWWNNIQNEANILSKEMTNLNTNIDSIKNKEQFFKNRDTNLDEIKKEMELKQSMNSENQTKMINDKDVLEIKESLHNQNKYVSIIRKDKIKTTKETKVIRKKKNDEESDNDEQISALEAKNKISKITGFSTINQETKNEYENNEDYTNITSKFLKIKNKNMMKLMNIKVNEGDLKVLDPKEFLDHIANFNINKIDFIRIETKFSIKKRNFYGENEKTDLLSKENKQSKFDAYLKNQMNQLVGYQNKYKQYWDMRYLRKYLPNNFAIRKQWSKMAMEKEDICQNTLIENVIIKNIDKHFFVQNEEENEKKEDSSHKNEEEDIEEFFKQKAEGDKQSENDLNQNTNNKDDSNIQEDKVNESALKEDMNDIDMNYNSKKDSRDQIKSTGAQNLAQQEQDEMELIRFKEQVDQFKLNLMQINKGHSQNYENHKNSSINIYVNQPDLLLETQTEMFKFFLKPPLSYQEQIESFNEIKDRIMELKDDQKKRKGKKSGKKNYNDGDTILDKLNMCRYMELGVKPFKDRLKQTLKQAQRCRNLKDKVIHDD